ncbi:hypothetical protein F5141DRAFT_1128389 [Pisolithus sp. B1]|nr:hypothetical protein F5141DRAFT_1128389 [Pisolithus sp. B1]
MTVRTRGYLDGDASQCGSFWKRQRTQSVIAGPCHHMKLSCAVETSPMLLMMEIKNLAAVIGNLRCEGRRSLSLLPSFGVVVPNGWSASLLCSWTCRWWLATKAAYSSAGRFALAWTRPKFRGHMRYCGGSKCRSPFPGLNPGGVYNMDC